MFHLPMNERTPYGIIGTVNGTTPIYAQVSPDIWITDYNAVRGKAVRFSSTSHPDGLNFGHFPDECLTLPNLCTDGISI